MSKLSIVAFFFFALNTITLTSQTIDTLDFKYTDLTGIGASKEVMRRDPSDVLKVDDRYYVWYTRGFIHQGYDATVWYATSPDGYNWTEQKECIQRGGVGSWDEQSVFTPYVFSAKGKYYMFFTGIAKNIAGSDTFSIKELGKLNTAIGLAVAKSPHGPWKKIKDPILEVSSDPNQFDSFRIDDACLLVRDNKYWLYYKGRQKGKSPKETKMGVAIADKPQGPYVKFEGNPIIMGNHEVVMFPMGKGVGALIGTTGPDHLINSIQHSAKGYTYNKLYNVKNNPVAAGLYNPEAHNQSNKGKMITWGVHIAKRRGYLPFIQRFDLVQPNSEKVSYQKKK